MQQIPNWFRWLIIVIATLIMCACRSPLYDTGLPLAPPIITGPQVVPNEFGSTNKSVSREHGVAEFLAEQAVTEALAPVTQGTHANVAPVVNGNAENELHAVVEMLAASPVVEEVAAESGSEASNQSAQIVLILDDDQVSLESSETLKPYVIESNAVLKHVAAPEFVAESETDIASEAETAIDADTAIEASASSETDAAVEDDTASSYATAIQQASVYMRLQDDQVKSAVGAEGDAAGTVAAANLQLESPVGQLDSPFADDPIQTPQATDAQLAPIVEPGFVVQEQEIGNTVEQAQPADTQWNPIPTAEPNFIEQQPGIEYSVEQSQPFGTAEIQPMTEGVVMPYEPAPAYEYPAPYEQHLPIVEIPMDVQPEHWAESPHTEHHVDQAELARLYPDEYICDGGDRLAPVVVQQDWTVKNLDPEDTVGHFDTLDNKVVVSPSNRVCIYAPRFAATRKVSGAYLTERNIEVGVAARRQLATIDQRNEITDQYSQTQMVHRHLLSLPPSSLKARQPGHEAIRSQALLVLDKDLSVHEDFRVMKLGIHKQAEKPRLAEASAKAISWSADKAVQVVVDGEIADTLIAKQGIDQYFVVGDNGPARLRVIKTASKSDALPGEEVIFTLRFDNKGFQPIGNVTIIDNLTTRLEYVEDSQMCSLEANFVDDLNEAESLMLRWEIEEPIKPGQGGLIRFRCRLR